MRTKNGLLFNFLERSLYLFQLSICPLLLVTMTKFQNQQIEYSKILQAIQEGDTKEVEKLLDNGMRTDFGAQVLSYILFLFFASYLHCSVIKS